MSNQGVGNNHLNSIKVALELNKACYDMLFAVETGDVGALELANAINKAADLTDKALIAISQQILPLKTAHDRWIVCAAIRNKRTGLIVCGVRHWDNIMRATVKAFDPDNENWIEKWIDAEQGFVDQRGNYLSRKEAHDIVIKTKQCTPELPGTLFSEDLY